MVLLMFSCVAAAYNPQSRVETVGKALITKNSLPNKTTFKVVEEADNSNTASDMIINISKDSLKYAGNDNEVAAIVAHNMGEIINGVAAKQKLKNYYLPTDAENQSAVSGMISNKIAMEDNKDSDIIGVDLMIKANYNPLAMVVVLTKMPGSTLEALSAKPNNSERAMNIFNYLSYNYPEKIKAGYNCQEYRAFLTYADPIVKERQANKKKLAKFNKEQEKEKAKRLKKINQYKTTGGVSGWDATYNILNGLTTGK